MSNIKKTIASSAIGAGLTTAITLSVVYSGFINDDYKLAIYIATFIVFLLFELFLILDKAMISKALFSLLGLAAFFTVVFLILDRIGFLEKIESVDSLRKYVASTGKFSVFVFIIIQFLQVVLIPIPGSVTTIAGAVLFGSVLGLVYSYIGIVLGSITAFLIGRIFGYKLVKWIVGEEQLKKALKLVEGKGNVMLILIFLLPFFPDDVICFVAGLMPISFLSFLIITLITRIITVGFTSFTVDLVQYFLRENLVLGIIILSIGIVLTAAVFFIGFKYGEKIENFFKEKFKSRIKKKMVIKNDGKNEYTSIEAEHGIKSEKDKNPDKIKKVES